MVVMVGVATEVATALMEMGDIPLFIQGSIYLRIKKIRENYIFEFDS